MNNKGYKKKITDFGLIVIIIWVILFIFKIIINNSPELEQQIQTYYDMFYLFFDVFGLLFLASQFVLNTQSLDTQLNMFKKQAEQMEIFKQEYYDKRKAILKGYVYNKSNQTIVRIYNVGLSAAYDIKCLINFKNNLINPKSKKRIITPIILKENQENVILAQQSIELETLMMIEDLKNLVSVEVSYKDLSTDITNTVNLLNY